MGAAHSVPSLAGPCYHLGGGGTDGGGGEAGRRAYS